MMLANGSVTPFQWITLCALAMILLCEVVAIVRGRGPRRLALVRSLVWLAAAIAIARPLAVQAVAEAIGIRRGADLVVYLLALSFAAATFFFYSRYLRLRRQLVELVRELAMLQARRGPVEGGGPRAGTDSKGPNG